MTERDDISTLAPLREHADALRPIRWLVAGAILISLMAGMLTWYTALLVIEDMDRNWASIERAKAASIADLLALTAPDEQQRAMERYGDLAGLAGLHIAPALPDGQHLQFMPLLNGPQRGAFLAWEAKRPGLVMLQRYAPSRMPLIGTMIMLVAIILLVLLVRVSRIERGRREAMAQAMRDPLTGLPNRLALEQELRRLDEGQRIYSVLALDLDRFKGINDNFGHAAGDMALKVIAGRLERLLRGDELLARTGGDEFVAVLLRGGSRAALTIFARDAIAQVSAPMRDIHPLATLGVSLGIVEQANALPYGTVLKRADRALYDAKRVTSEAFCFALAPEWEEDSAVLPMDLDGNAGLAARG